MNASDYDFFALLKKLLNVNNRDTDQLVFKQNVGNNSIYLGPYKLFQCYSTKQNNYICCRNDTLPLVEKHKVPYKKSATQSDNFAIRISTDDIRIINMIAPFWIDLYDDVYIKNSRDTFSCCSRWLECSNALECTNPDKSAARLCKYKRNLEKGLIFEGTYSVINEHGAIDYDKVTRNASLLKRSEIMLIDVNDGGIMRCEYKPMGELRGNRTEDIVHDYVVIDIETTGLKYSDEIIEFAAIRVKDDEPVEKLSFLVKPQNAIPDKISQLTGITNSMVENESFFVDRINDILGFMGDDLILGHNVIFDIDRLNYNIYTNTGKNLSNDYIDTLHLAHDRITDIDNYQLETLADYFNIDVNISHRAVDDCYTTIECYKHLSSIRPHIDDFACNQKKSNYYGYHFLNKCDEIIYKKTGNDRDLSDIVYTLYGRPYYASPAMFDYILRQNGAKESPIYDFDAIIDDIYYFGDIKRYIDLRLKRLTHLIAGKNKYEECISNKDITAIAQKYNIEIVPETEIYKMLGIELPEFKTQSSVHNHIRSKDVSATTMVFDEHHSLFNKTIVITGALNTLSRSEAYLKIKNVGGFCGDSITKKTNYLVTNSEKLTGKMKKALEYKEQGQDIKIINEADLVKLLNNEK